MCQLRHGRSHQDQQKVSKLQIQVQVLWVEYAGQDQPVHAGAGACDHVLSWTWLSVLICFYVLIVPLFAFVFLAQLWSCDRGSEARFCSALRESVPTLFSDTSEQELSIACFALTCAHLRMSANVF